MTKIKLKVHAVIFDLDGVITDTMPFHYRAWKSVLAQEGLRVTRNDIYQREGQRGISSLMGIFKDYGKTCTPQKAEELLRQKEDLFKKIVKRKFIPGAHGFLKYLAANDISLALVTGTAMHEVYKILPKNILKLFEVMITGSDVKIGKPHPEPYQKALKGLNANPARIVVIENAPLGIESAKAAGLKCLALATSLPNSFLKNADAVYPSFAALKRGVCFVQGNDLAGRVI